MSYITATIPALEPKVCVRCGNSFPSFEFNKSSYCKKCRGEKNKTYFRKSCGYSETHLDWKGNINILKERKLYG